MRWTAASASLPAISISPMWLTSKSPARVADGQVLVGDAGVFDRHVPAAKRHHPRAGGAMTGVERGFLEGRVGDLFHERARARVDGDR